MIFQTIPLMMNFFLTHEAIHLMQNLSMVRDTVTLHIHTVFRLNF